MRTPSSARVTSSRSCAWSAAGVVCPGMSSTRRGPDRRRQGRGGARRTHRWMRDDEATGPPNAGVSARRALGGNGPMHWRAYFPDAPLRASFLSDRGLSFNALVPRLGARGHLHRALMALAGQQHAVAWPRDLDGTLDRGAPVEHDLVVEAGSLAYDPRLHIPCDLSRVFQERVVGRDDEKVGEFGRRFTHSRPVVVGAGGRAEHGDQPAASEGTQLRQCAGERAGRVREVDEDAEVLPEVDPFQPPAHAIEAGQPRTDLFDRHAYGEADTRGAERVLDVEACRHGQ